MAMITAKVMTRASSLPKRYYWIPPVEESAVEYFFKVCAGNPEQVAATSYRKGKLCVTLQNGTRWVIDLRDRRIR